MNLALRSRIKSITNNSQIGVTSSPLFSNFSRLRCAMRQEIRQNGLNEYQNIYVCNSSLLSFMKTHFPKYMNHRHIGNINTDHFKHWDDTKENYINIESSVSDTKWDELNDLIESDDDKYDFVSIGGPSAFLSNHEYIINNEDNKNDIKSAHFYLSRHDSNYDGSAYYYHERDSFPVYINKVNRGPFCMFIDLFKRMYCLLSKDGFINYCERNEGFVKININWKNILKKPSMLYTIFAKNFYLMVKNLYFNGKDLNNCLLHAQQTPNVVEKFVNYYKNKLNFEDLLLLNKEEIKAIYVNIDENYQCNKHFAWMNKKFGNIPFINMNKNEMKKKYGFDLKYIKEIIGFPNDGCINPHFLNNLVNVFQGQYEENWMIKDVYYSDNDKNKDANIICKLESKSEEDDNKDEIKYIKTSKLSLSLGPSANYKLDNKSFLNDYMFASGSTSVAVFAIKCDGNYKERADKFINKCSLFIDSVNQHWTPIEIKKDIKLDLDKNGSEELYHLAVLQMTGGGNFPSRHTSPDVVLNLLSNCEKIFGLKEFEDNSIYYDIVQLRGCGRGVTAGNTISFTALNNNNICITYGLGGIGMTTMFANAMLINQILDDDNKNEFKSKGILNHIDYKSMVNII